LTYKEEGLIEDVETLDFDETQQITNEDNSRNSRSSGAFDLAKVIDLLMCLKLYR
jgi:hypothetical protein